MNDGTATTAVDFDPVAAAADGASPGELFTPEERAQLDQAMADIVAGRVELVDNNDVPVWLEGYAAARARG